MNTIVGTRRCLTWRTQVARQSGSCHSLSNCAFFGGKERPDVWVQRYDPLGNWPASTLAAALPVLVLLGLLASGRVNAGGAALAGLLAACAMAFFVFGMPADMIVASAVVGLVFAVFRIVWLIVAAVFLYDIAVTTGQFEVMKASVARLSADRRLQAVLVAFSFGAFIEGAAGFGAPVAISAAFLVGLGFQPFQAALLCLIANTAPVAWGGIGTPLADLERGHRAGRRGLERHFADGSCPLLSVLIPFWLVRTMTGWRNTLEVWLPLLVIGGTFASVQFLWSNFVGFELVDIVASVSQHGGRGHRAPSLEARADLAVRPRGGSQPVAVDAPPPLRTVRRALRSRLPLAPGRVARAWMPFALLTVTVLVWGFRPSSRGELPRSRTGSTPGSPGSRKFPRCI